MKTRFKFEFDIDDTNFNEWTQLICQWLYDIGYRNKKNNSKYTDTVTIKYNFSNYLSFSMPRLEDGIFKIHSKTLPKLKSLYYIASDGLDNVYIPLNKRRKTFKHNNCFYKSDSKTMIPNIDYLCLECDNASFRKQLELIKLLKPYVRSAIFSGNKSIHIWLSTDIITYNSPIKGVANNPDSLNTIKDYIKDIASRIDLTANNYDLKVLNDYSTWVRLPFCKRKDKYSTRLVYHNPISSKLINTDIFEFDHELEDIYTDYSDDISSPINTVLVNDHTFEDTKVINDKKTNNSYLNFIPNYFENLTDYVKYKTYGLDSTGLRLKMYKDVIVSNRILSSSINTVLVNDHTFENKCVDDVKEILELSSGKYRCSYDEAINDFKEYFKNTNVIGMKILRPDVMSINVDNSKERLEGIKNRLESLGIPESKNVARIINNLLLAKIMSLPAQCNEGSLGLHMRNEINKNHNVKKTKKVLESMKENNILVKKKNYSIDAKQTNKYWVNIPLVLWLTHEMNELNWG